jgi:inhibitor of KinA sporulation pathway (predicted exonuclease)
MSYVVVDFEWNQAMRSDSAVFNKLPIHLRGEIIEIGAVKLNADLTLGEEFTIDVRPAYFRQIHYKVKKLTGFDRDRLSHGVSFPEAWQKFKEFCGEGVTFLTWGCDDRGIFEQNVIIHDLDWDWIDDWVNLQLIYNVQTGGDKNQKSLAAAMEHFEIEQTRIAHDALGDAYNTALVSTHLDMEEGLRLYPEAEEILARRMPNYKPPVESVPMQEALLHDSFSSFETKAEAFADVKERALSCLVCGQAAEGGRWISQSDGRYMNLFSCEEHGAFLTRIRLKKDADTELWTANRLIYEADEEMQEFYRTKVSQARRRGRGRNQRKKRPA